MIAARRGALAAMNALFDAGADPNRRDRRFDWTPLMHAVHKGQAKATEALLERGADPNLGTEGGLTPLMMAAGDPIRGSSSCCWRTGGIRERPARMETRRSRALFPAAR